METTTLAVVTEHNARWAAADVPGLCALHHPDMVFTDHYTGTRYTGHALRAHIAAVIGRSALDTLTYTDRVRVDGDTATLRYREVIRSTKGDTMLVVSACDVVRVVDGLIASIDEYGIPEMTASPAASRRAAARKIGLTARAVGHLLADLDDWMARGEAFRDPALSLQQLANDTGYTRNQISFALNQVRGVSFFEWVNRVRVHHLLRALPLPAEGGVLAWSEQAGFRSASTFYKTFRAVTGQSPAEWARARKTP